MYSGRITGAEWHSKRVIYEITIDHTTKEENAMILRVTPYHVALRGSDWRDLRFRINERWCMEMGQLGNQIVGRRNRNKKKSEGAVVVASLPPEYDHSGVVHHIRASAMDIH